MIDGINNQASDGWQPIQLTGRQTIGAFWSISWPAGLASVLFELGVIGFVPIGTSPGLIRAYSAPALLIFVCVQWLLVPRLVRKRYKTFYIRVIREDNLQDSKLSTGEIARLYMQLFWPQIALVIAQSMLRIPSVFYIGLYFLFVGPFALRLALRRCHAGYRMQAFGIRYI